MKYILLLLILSFSLNLTAQKKTKIKLLRADKLSPALYNGIKVQKLSGKVVFQHESTMMYCDSAYFYDGKNSLDAFGKIHINDNDSIHIYGDTLNYKGDTKLAEIHGRVRLVDKKMTLTTKHLRYDLRSKVGYYYTGGKIVDETNTLTSILGYYYSSTSTVYFQNTVVLINKQYQMYSDTLIYNTSSETSYFHGPTVIKSEENSIYCEKGWYDTKSNLSRYQTNTVLRNDKQELFADSLFYDRNRSFGQAFIHVTLIDTTQNLIMKGQYAEYYENNGSSFFTDSSIAILIDDKKDSLYIHADTLRIVMDSANKAKDFIAYNHVKFFKKDLQGKCDSLIYHLQDSILLMLNDPIIWGSNSQITGMKIRAFMKKGGIDKIYIDTNAFVLQHDSLTYYNQVSGNNMVTHFAEGKINRVDVYSNAQTVYFAREDDGSLVGVNLGNSSDMRVDFDKDGVTNIIYLNTPKASLNPISKVSKRALFLRGFKSYEHWRPKTKDEIFTWEPLRSN